MTVSTGLGAAVGGCESVVPGTAGCDGAAGEGAALLCRKSARPSRRAVLHVQTAGETLQPPELPAWFSERAFHVYRVGLRAADQPGRLARLAGPVRGARRRLEPVLAGLDAARAHLREVEGIEHLVVTAQGSAALAAAVWCESPGRGSPGQERLGQERLGQERLGQEGPAQGGPGAEALILFGPELPGRGMPRLAIDCPVLVLTGPEQERRGLRGPRRAGGTGAPAARLGSHVTWLRLPGDVAGCLTEAGRWLGAYMYGQLRDQLL